MKRILHSCRICKVPVELHQDDDCPDFTAHTLARMMVCNRCGDFRKAWWRLEGTIKHICNRVWQEQSRNEPREGVIPLCRKRLMEATRALAIKTCEHYRLQFFWDEDFVSQLMEQPEKAAFILTIYERSVSKMREPLSEQMKMREEVG